jgi:protein involved in polysaccharide export with SLBB domain
MVVELNPIVLQQRPEFDVTLEGGDQITIPRRPLSVFISGEVFNPGAQQFSTTTSISEYLEAAGGVTDDADLSNAFIIRPNGSAMRINFSVWGSSNDEILPGSWIVVPRDIAPFRMREFATTVTQIFSQLAVSAASIAVISRN